MKLTKEKIFAITGAILFYIMLFFILYFAFLKTKIKVKEEGILVNFESVNSATETITPKGEVNEAAPQEANQESQSQETPEIPQPQPQKIPPVAQPKQQKKPTTPKITQNLEKTAAAEAAKQKQKEKAAAEQAAKAEQARLAEERRKREAINRQVSGAFATDNNNRGGQGTGQAGSGVQGNPRETSATAQSKNSYGEFNLGGRTLGGELPRPAYSAQEEGNIVIDIVVDPRGNVILAEIGKGTTINSHTMRKSALEAASKAKFNSIAGNNNQSGTIIYKYNLK
jgi:TonB family protein